MCAFTGTRYFNGRRDVHITTRVYEGRDIFMPFSLVKIDSQEIATVIWQKRINANRMSTRQMIVNYLIRKRQQNAVCTVAALHLRLETDILGGQNAACPTALVLSGVSTFEQAQVWQPQPTIIAKDLSSLLND